MARACDRGDRHGRVARVDASRAPAPKQRRRDRASPSTRPEVVANAGDVGAGSGRISVLVIRFADLSATDLHGIARVGFFAPERWPVVRVGDVRPALRVGVDAKVIE